jgi:hypothetical protein
MASLLGDVVVLPERVVDQLRGDASPWRAKSSGSSVNVLLIDCPWFGPMEPNHSGSSFAVLNDRRTRPHCVRLWNRHQAAVVGIVRRAGLTS